MFKRFSRSSSDEAERRLASAAGRSSVAVADVPAPTPAAEFHAPPLPPDAEAPSEPSDRFGTLRRSVQQRLEDEPRETRPATGLLTRLRGRFIGDSPDPLVIGIAVVLVAIIGIAIVVFASHNGGSNHPQTAQAVDEPIVATATLAPPARVARTPAPRPTSVAAFAAQTPPAATVPRPPTPAVAATPLLRAARSAPFEPPRPSAAAQPSVPAAPAAAPAAAAPGLANRVNAAALQPPPVSIITTNQPIPAGQPFVGAQSAPAASGAAAPAGAAAGAPAPTAPPEPPAPPPPVAPAVSNIAAAAQRAATAAGRTQGGATAPAPTPAGGP